MDWSSADVPGTFRLFKQKCQIYFTVKDIKKEMMVNHILLYAGDDGIKLYNSWTLTDTERNDPDVVWGKFQDHIEPKVNFRLQRFYLQKYSQAAGESIDDYITRCTLQAQKCRFSPAEANERLIEQLIIGTTIPEVQKQLLSYDETLTLDKALNIGRTTEASINHMTQLQGVQDNTEVHYVKRAENNGSVRRDGCGYCGRSHQKTDQCPAFVSTCRKCGGRNHWESVCRKQSPRGQGGPHGRSKSRDTRPRRHFDGPSRGQRGRRGRRDSRVHAVGLEREPRDDTADRFEHLSFASLTTHRGSSDARDEVFATLDIQLPSARNGRTADLRVKVDTGAQGNILPLRIFAKMFPEAMTGRHPTPGALLRKSNTVLSAYNGTRIPQYGTIVIACRHDQSAWIDAKFYVADTDGPAILGLPNSRQLRLITLHCAIEKSKLEQTGTGDSDAINSTQTLKQRYPDRFDTLGDFKGKYHIVIDRDVQPVIHAPRKCPIQLKDELQAALNTMEKENVIKKVTRPTDWVSSLAYSRKKDGTLRICLDPKDLNRAIKRCHHKTPTLEEIMHKFVGAKHFSKLDAKNGYWSVTLDEESSLLTTFNSPFGRYCFVRMPFGLVMSQDVFQQKMDMILESCPGTVGIADDVAVFGHTEAEHDAHVHNLMRVSREHGLVFNSKKCTIKAPYITFFGTLYDKDGAHPDPKKVEDIHKIPTPTNATELQEFLGIVTYMGPFIPNLSKSTASLRDLLKKDIDFQWSDAHQNVFEKVKAAICAETTLAYFDRDKDTVIQVDASGRGLGAVLLQEGRPIAYASKSLTDTEKRYANIERELLAVVFGAERFRTYVYGKPFVIESDHKPLEMIQLKNLTAAPPRLQRMLLRIQHYNVTIKYRPGKELLLADGLSRLPNPQEKDEIDLDVMVSTVLFSNAKIDELRNETLKDTVLRELLNTIIRGWPERRDNMQKDLRPYWCYRDELSVEDGVILKGDRVLIPESMRADVMKRLHAGHQGVEKCKLRAKISVFWDGINKDIEEVVQRCDVCQTHQRSTPKETLMPHELPTRPWQVLGTDLFHFNNAEYLIVVDYYSKFPLIRKMPTPCTSHAVVTATAEIFSEHGAPQKVMSDNGPQYDCINYRKFAEEWGFEHVTSSPHFPQSNGFVERNIQSVKRTLLKARESGVNPHKAMLCLRTTPIDHHLPSPGELLYARKMKDDLPIQMRNVLAHRDEIHARLEQRQDTQKLYHDTRAHDLPPLATGQQVRVQDHASGRWKPATVTATCDEPRSYLVEAQNGRILRRNRRHLRTTGSPRRVHFADETAEADDVTSHVQPVQQQAASTASRQRDEGARRADDATHPSYRTRSGRVITQPERLDL